MTTLKISITFKINASIDLSQDAMDIQNQIAIFLHRQASLLEFQIFEDRYDLLSPKGYEPIHNVHHLHFELERQLSSQKKTYQMLKIFDGLSSLLSDEEWISCDFSYSIS